MARHLALAQYIGGQLKFRPALLAAAMFTRSTPDDLPKTASAQRSKPAPTVAAVARSHQVVDAVVDAFYADAGPYLRGKLVVVVDGRRGGPAAEPELLDVERTYLMQRLHQRGAIVQDMEPRYAEHAASSPRSLSVGPYDGHLNAIGVRLAMTAAAEALSR